MPNILPRQFRVSHRYAFSLHDELVDFIVQGEPAGIFHFRVPMEGLDPYKGLQGTELYSALENDARWDILDEFTIRMLVRGLLTDFCHFVCEGLRASRKGKLTVAYSLFRKPFRDNLFMLEWILADRAEYLRRFRAGPEHLEIAKIAPQQRIQIIRTAMEKCADGEWLGADFLHELRFDKKVDYGFLPLFDKALHIVTTSKGCETEPENLNFVFADEESYLFQWDQNYFLLPPMLYHAVMVVNELVRSFMPDFALCSPVREYRRTVGYLLWAERFGDKDVKGEAGRLMAQVVDATGLECPACGEALLFDRPNLRTFWQCAQVQCRSCPQLIPLELPVQQSDPAE